MGPRRPLPSLSPFPRHPVNPSLPSPPRRRGPSRPPSPLRSSAGVTPAQARAQPLVNPPSGRATEANPLSRRPCGGRDPSAFPGNAADNARPTPPPAPKHLSRHPRPVTPARAGAQTPVNPSPQLCLLHPTPLPASPPPLLCTTRNRIPYRANHQPFRPESTTMLMPQPAPHPVP